MQNKCSQRQIDIYQMMVSVVQRHNCESFRENQSHYTGNNLFYFFVHKRNSFICFFLSSFFKNFFLLIYNLSFQTIKKLF